MRALDPASPLHLYVQIARWIEGQIREGELREGDRLESEPALARRLGVGRPTVRQATELLVRRGLLERRRGTGTFVRAAAPAVDLLGLGGTLASIRDSGVAIETRALSPVRPGDDALHLTRLHSLGERPVVLEELSFDREVFAALEGRTFERNSLSAAVRDELGLRLDHAEQSFAVAPLEENRAQLLKISPGTPLLRVERTLVFGGVGPAAWATLHCRTEELRFRQVLQGESP